MKIQELTESEQPPFKVIAQGDYGVWYELDASQIVQWITSVFNNRPFIHTTDRYFVLVPKNKEIKDRQNEVLTLDGDDLRAVTANTIFNTPASGQALTGLVGVVPAQTSKQVPGNYLVYDGNTYRKIEFPNLLPVIGEISTGTVHEVPEQAVWVMNRLHVKFLHKADRRIVFKVNSNWQMPWGGVSVKSGVLSDIISYYEPDTLDKSKLSKELSELLGVEKKVSAVTHLLPSGRLHKVLEVIQRHPEVMRRSLYLNLLKLSKIPSHRAPDDSTHELVQLGLITQNSEWGTDMAKYTITPVGKLVLLRLNAGKSVPKHTLIKS